MENNKYIEILKITISGNAMEYAQKNVLTPGYFNTLFAQIRDSVMNVARLLKYPEVDNTTLENYFDIALREYLSTNPIEIDPSNSLTKENYKTWLTAERKDLISWDYTNRYISALEKTGRSEKVIHETITSSMDILEKIGDPKSDSPFYVKGLVVGSVQSGKTGNFNAVINRAIDSGYGLIIVLSGIMEDLRSQTQLRIEDDIIGFGMADMTTGTKGVKGVGKIRRFGNQGDKSVDQVFPVTSYISDFNKTLIDANFSLNHTNILVCKKNVSVLRNLLVWLHDYLEENKDKHDIPLLILDDEADNASLNNLGGKGREYASKTNGHIRALLGLFSRKTYLGYTATPFANVLQDRNEEPENTWTVMGGIDEKHLSQVDNLFPDHFIILLNPPTNYIGAKQIFDTIEPIANKKNRKLPLIEFIKDHVPEFPSRVRMQEDGVIVGVPNFTQDEFDKLGGYLDFNTYKEFRKGTRASKPDDKFPKTLPKSLQDSLLCFILSIAIRESRKQKLMYSAAYIPHHTMLIHISRFSMWQNRTKELIVAYIKKLQVDIDNDIPGSSDSIYTQLEKIWYDYYAYIIENIELYLPRGYDDKFMVPISFESLKNFLPDAVNGIDIKAVNSITKEGLEYPKNASKKIIAIGGNRLSRGFTLEGLSINYFIRSTDYSDTLLQMGRWFGYRPGYLDCCKLFATKESIDKFHSATLTIEELESEFRKMEKKNRTPKDFVLRVRKHPGTLKITRPSILKTSKEVKWSYQDKIEQTSVFNIERKKIEDVWVNFKNKIAPSFNELIGDFLTYNTGIDGLIELLESPNNFDDDTRKSIIMFLKRCKEKGKLTKWTIALKTTGRGSQLWSKDSGLTKDIDLSIRRGPGKENIEQQRFIENMIFRASGKSANIISAGTDFSILLSAEQKTSAVAEFRLEQKKLILEKYPNLSQLDAEQQANEKTVPERVYRERMSDQDGLLIIYLFDATHVFRQDGENKDKNLKDMVEKHGYDLTIPLVGYAIGFPPIDPDPGVHYLQGDYDILEDDEEYVEDESDLEIFADING